MLTGFSINTIHEASRSNINNDANVLMIMLMKCGANRETDEHIYIYI